MICVYPYFRKHPHTLNNQSPLFSIAAHRDFLLLSPPSGTLTPGGKGGGGGGPVIGKFWPPTSVKIFCFFMCFCVP